MCFNLLYIDFVKVIQSLAAHPKLVNFVMTILTKLISRQVGLYLCLGMSI